MNPALTRGEVVLLMRVLGMRTAELARSRLALGTKTLNPNGEEAQCRRLNAKLRASLKEKKQKPQQVMNT